MPKKTRVTSPMEASLRPKIDPSGPSDARHNRAGHVVGYGTGDKKMKNLWEPSFPQSLAYEGQPAKNPEFTLGDVAGKKAAEGFASKTPEPQGGAAGQKD